MEKSPIEIKLQIIQDLNKACKSFKSGLISESYCPYVYGLFSFLSKKGYADFEKRIKQYVDYLEITNSPILKIDDALQFIEKNVFNNSNIELITYFLTHSKEKEMDYYIIRNFILQLSFSHEPLPKNKMKVRLLVELLNEYEVNTLNKQNVKLILYFILKINLYPVKNYLSLKEVKKSYWLLIYWIKNILHHNGLLAVHQNYLTTLNHLPSAIKFSWTKKNIQIINRIFQIVPTEKLRKFIAYTKMKNVLGINKYCPELFYKYTPDKEEFLNTDCLIEPFLKGIIVPEVFIKKFGIMRTEENKVFIHFLNGGRLRDYEKLPIKMDRKASHELRNLKTNDKLEFWEYFFVARLISEELDYEYAREVYRNIRGYLIDYNFWADTMVLLYKKGLKYRDINEVMDYISHELVAQNKNTDLKTKKLANLLSDSRKWHDNHKELKVPNKNLRKSFIDDFYFVDAENEKHVIKQLLTTRELYIEGEELHHCVYNYASSCIFSNRFIFSLRLLKDGDEKKLITIEVSNRTIVQAKGLYNRYVESKELEIIKCWAQEKGLTLSVSTGYH